MNQVDVLIYRGTGGVQNKAHRYYNEPPLVRAGHVGLAGIIDDVILGFHPAPDAVEMVGSEQQVIELLTEQKAIPGCLQNDTHYFERAFQLADETGGRTTVYIYTVEITDETLKKIQTWYNEKQKVPYAFPDSDGQFANQETNCAMFWFVWFGIPLPFKTGSIRQLTDHMKLKGYDTWQPDAS